jgi:hypothetical protein
MPERSRKKGKDLLKLLFPVGDDIQAIVVDRVEFPRRDKLWSDDDPLFPWAAC